MELKMRRNNAAPKRRIRSPIAAAAALVAAGIATAGIVTPQAHAESGRRICVYSYKQYVQEGLDGALTRYSVGINYKKDGACPGLDGNRFPSYLPHGSDIATGSIRKQTCEEWGKAHSLDRLDSLMLTNADPCRVMTVDHVYVFEWQSPTTPEAAKPRLIDLGPYWDYQG
ncbi:MAG TPA: hypothetical protein VI248_04115 [Kineosporiaceae bacterium]